MGLRNLENVQHFYTSDSKTIGGERKKKRVLGKSNEETSEWSKVPKFVPQGEAEKRTAVPQN